MTDRPILFSAPMVSAILREIAAPGAGKTQTRRLLKPQPEMIGDHGAWRWDRRQKGFAGSMGSHIQDFPRSASFWCGYRRGDRLWVREAWRAGRGYDGASIRDVAPGSRVWCEADDARDNCDAIGLRLRPSIHMPRWASRLTLHVTDVRVQRLQEISEDDARSEGVKALQIRPVCDRGQQPETWWFGTDTGRATAKSAFRDLWESLNDERAHWLSNPWVVAVTFRPLLANIDSRLASLEGNS